MQNTHLKKNGNSASALDGEYSLGLFEEKYESSCRSHTNNVIHDVSQDPSCQTAVSGASKGGLTKGHGDPTVKGWTF